MIEVKSGIQ